MNGILSAQMNEQQLMLDKAENEFLVSIDIFMFVSLHHIHPITIFTCGGNGCTPRTRNLLAFKHVDTLYIDTFSCVGGMQCVVYGVRVHVCSNE